MKDEYKIRTTYQFLFIMLISVIMGYVLFQNLTPLGVTISYDTTLNKEINPGPPDRVLTKSENGEIIYYQTDDLVYFSTPMRFRFDQALIRVTFQNPWPDQEIYLGFKDRKEWHFQSKAFDAPFINNLAWKLVGQGPYLLQKIPKYTSIEDFLTDPPKDMVIGIYDYDKNFFANSAVTIPNYKPTTSETTIDTPLRGGHIFYAYLKDEPFRMKVQKQDLNWYADPDVVVVKVYKDDDLVYTATIDDDGIDDDSRRVFPPQEIEIKNPGPGLPENGIYKVIIDASDDSIINRITTNLHKIVFQGPVFPAANSFVYSKVVSQTVPTQLHTNALILTAKTYHSSALQSIVVGTERINLNALNTEEVLRPQENFTSIIAPKSDVMINGMFGYFSFKEDQFFESSSYRILPITNSQDTELANYILTNYTPSERRGDWQVAEQTFDLNSAYIKDKKLSWLIKAPRLKSNGHSIRIKKIEIQLIKKSWFN